MKKKKKLHSGIKFKKWIPHKSSKKLLAKSCFETKSSSRWSVLYAVILRCSTRGSPHAPRWESCSLSEEFPQAWEYFRILWPTSSVKAHIFFHMREKEDPHSFQSVPRKCCQFGKKIIIAHTLTAAYNWPALNWAIVKRRGCMHSNISQRLQAF